MATARDLCEAALREIGILAAGETAAAADASDAFTRLNRLLARFGTERLTLYTRTRSTWTITADDGNYSIGATGDVVITRPVYVDGIGYIETDTDPDTEYQLREMTEAEWQRVPLKAQSATYPSHYYYNPTFPNATVDLWPVPSSSTLEGVIYHWAALTQFTNLSTDVSLPPGYEEMLITNLAMLLCPSYGVQPHPVLMDTASRTLADIKRANIRDYELEMEATASFRPRWRSGYDINLG